MSVLPSDIVFYGCANMTESDGATVGGAIDMHKGVDLTDLSVNDTLDVVSSSASDTATSISYVIVDQYGVMQTVTEVLTGTTPVAGAQLASSLDAAAISGGAIGSIATVSGSAAVGDVALYGHTPALSASTAQAGSANASGTTPALIKLKAGDGAKVSVGQIIRITSGTGANQLRRIIDATSYGTDIVAVNRNWDTIPDATSVYNVVNGMLFDIGPNPIRARTRLFATSYSAALGGSVNVFYEKLFIVNNNTGTAFTPQGSNSGVGISIGGASPSLPGGTLLDMGISASVGDSLTIPNRKTAPSGIAFVTQPATIFIPSPGILSPGAAPNTANAIGIWLRYTLPAGAQPYRGSFSINFTGSTV